MVRAALPPDWRCARFSQSSHDGRVNASCSRNPTGCSGLSEGRLTHPPRPPVQCQGPHVAFRSGSSPSPTGTAGPGTHTLVSLPTAAAASTPGARLRGRPRSSEGAAAPRTPWKRERPCRGAAFARPACFTASTARPSVSLTSLPWCLHLHFLIQSGRQIFLTIRFAVAVAVVV